ncbi:MAG: hypothetical protein U0487_02660 [Patescibacteria group bacterium]
MNKRKMTYALAAFIPIFALAFSTMTVQAATFDHFGTRPALTQEQKDALDQAKQLFDQGKKDEAKALLDKAGVKPPQGKHGPRGEESAEMKAHHEAVMAAIKANDFAKFKELTKDAPFADQIDAAAFAAGRKPKRCAAGDEAGAKDLLKDVIKHDMGNT